MAKEHFTRERPLLMAWIAISCPQCGAPLPRSAIWRAVKCGSCGALVAKTESVVHREAFRQALVRARQGSIPIDRAIQCAGARYELMQLLGTGEDSQIYEARRAGILPFQAVVKLASSKSAIERHVREALVLSQLQALDDGSAGAYFSQRLPEVMWQGAVEGGSGRHAVILRHSSGLWGSLGALNDRFPQGLDPRHAVWIWRRILEVLSFVHRQGWSHGDVRPEHALINPRDHGVRLIGWASAHAGAGEQARATDLLRSARLVWVLLNGFSEAGGVPNHLPKDLAQLVTRAAQDQEFCRLHGAEGLDDLLRAAAKTAFGPPSFVPLIV